RGGAFLQAASQTKRAAPMRAVARCSRPLRARGTRARGARCPRRWAGQVAPWGVRRRSGDPQKGVRAPLLADGGGGTVAGDDMGVLRERHQSIAQRAKDEIAVTSPEIGAPDAATEERVAGEGDR